MTWWTENPEKAEKHLGKRAARYKSDEAYREAIKQRVRRRRDGLKKTEFHQAAPQRRVIYKNGEFVVLFGSRELSELFSTSVLKLVKENKLSPVMKDTSGRSWFELDQVEKVLKAG